MTAAELSRLASELELDAVGAAPAEPYESTEEHIRDRRERGSSPTCGSRWRGRRSRVIPNGCSTGREPWSPRRSATTSRARTRDRTKGACRATRGATATRICARGSTSWDAPRRALPRPRRRQRPCRPRRRRPCGRWLLRKEHDGDHPVAWLVGRPRDARHGRGDRSDARRSSSTAAPAVSASTRAPRARSTSPASSTRRAASRTGRKRRSRSPSATAPSSGRWCTGATSARTSARGTARSSDAARRRPERRLHADGLAAGLARARRRRSRRRARPPLRSAKRSAVAAPQRARRGGERRHRRARPVHPGACRRPTTRCSARRPRGHSSASPHVRRDDARISASSWLSWCTRCEARRLRSLRSSARSDRSASTTPRSGRSSTSRSPRVAASSGSSRTPLSARCGSRRSTSPTSSETRPRAPASAAREFARSSDSRPPARARRPDPAATGLGQPHRKRRRGRRAGGRGRGWSTRASTDGDRHRRRLGWGIPVEDHGAHLRPGRAPRSRE